MIFNTKTYDTLKWVALVALPLAAALYLGLGGLWHWDNARQVASSIALVDTFLGGLLQLSSSQFKNSTAGVDGFIGSDAVDPDTGIPDLKMTITKHPNDLLGKKKVVLAVGAPPVVRVKRNPDA